MPANATMPDAPATSSTAGNRPAEETLPGDIDGADDIFPVLRRPRTATNTAEIDTAITHPGSVKINVKGAFIVDQESMTPASGGGIGIRNGQGSPTHHETSDIRLPNHTAVVSHLAIDVSLLSCCVYNSFSFLFPCRAPFSATGRV